MTTWRYCISREQVIDPIGRPSDLYGIRELYDDNGKLSWTQDRVAPFGETWQELADDLSHMSSAVNAKVLDLTLDPPQLVDPHEVRGE